jgi:hypothetical protein
MLDAGYLRYKWLNLLKLSQNLLKDEQILIDVKYFTSKISGNELKQKRQKKYLEALSESGVKVIF